MTPDQGAPNKTADLPNWDLSDLYAGRDDPAVDRDLAGAAAKAGEFRRQYEGRLACLDGAGFLAAILDYERIAESLARVGSFAQLLYAGNMVDPEIGRFQQNVVERSNEISLNTLFFALEINKLDDANLAAKFEHQALRRFRPWLDQVRAFRPHQLSDDIERLLHEKEMVGRASWMRLFDETIADMRFKVRDDKLTASDALNLLHDRDPALRREAAGAIATGFAENQRVFALVTNTLAKDKEINDKWRAFARPVSARNLENQVEDGVVDALVEAVKAGYPNLSHRYYRLKARWLGQKRLEYWDRNAPLPEDTDAPIAWKDAITMVLGAYRDFAPRLAEIGQRFFDRNWIDAPPRPGKAPGAFAHPTVPGAHPYLLLNYHGRTRDVMTLAHELGHGVHQVLAAPLGQLLCDTPLTLAETASVFGEMLTFQALLRREGSSSRRRILLASKVEDMLNTVVRQVAMHEFERRLHDERRKGELTSDRISEIWLECQREALGDGVHLPDGTGYGIYWAYIPHFIHVPFYVYAYAFGDCLVNSLYAVYRQAAPGFAEKYLDMLASGGAKRHKELLAPFGLDATQPEFWSRGLGVIAGFIDELEAMG